MTIKVLGLMQIGKQGLTENFLKTLKLYFQTHANVKISVLKSAGHEKAKVKEIAEEILGELGNNYTVKTLGFTIFLKKWRKSVR